ncbi:MAG: DUF814 domain-containing protein [Desulfobacteraceae bacterium]|nr:MAG: DUF814 domain-containing protein [Desulfobacteraceae bacterium]
MNHSDRATPAKALGLCSGGLDSILSALVLVRQGIDVTWVAFETPFFSAKEARNAAKQNNIPLIVKDITDDYMEMLKAPKAGFGKNMNPCMDCHALMFAKAGDMMKDMGFDFLFSGEVMGQRPKSQTKNALRYVQKNSGFRDRILRPLSAKLLEETVMEKEGLVDRERLHDISGRSRKEQIRLADEFGVTHYPSPAGGCLLTDAVFSRRLKDLLDSQESYQKKELYLLKMGRHFRLDRRFKAIVGRSQADNKQIMSHYDPQRDVLIKHAALPGPDMLIIGPGFMQQAPEERIETAAMICAAYSKSDTPDRSRVRIRHPEGESVLDVQRVETDQFSPFMV